MSVARNAIARNRYARRKERAFVGFIFHRDPHRNRLEALKSGGWLKVRTLLAAMQLGITFGTSAREVGAGRQCGGAIETSRRGDVLHQARKPGACDVNRGTGTLRLWPFAKRLGLAVCILIAVLSVFAIAVH